MKRILYVVLRKIFFLRWMVRVNVLAKCPLNRRRTFRITFANTTETVFTENIADKQETVYFHTDENWNLVVGNKRKECFKRVVQFLKQHTIPPRKQIRKVWCVVVNLRLYSDAHKWWPKQNLVTFLYKLMCVGSSAWGGLVKVPGKRRAPPLASTRSHCPP